MNTHCAYTLLGLLLLLVAAGCDRTVGRLDLVIIGPDDPDQIPFNDQVDRVRVRIEGSDFGVLIQELDYRSGAEVPVVEVPVGSRRVVTVEALTEAGVVVARGQSLPLEVRDDDHRLELYVAWIGRFSATAAAANPDRSGSARGGHLAVPLADGQVALLAGGRRLDLETLQVEEPLTEVDLFDPTAARIARAGDCPAEGGAPGADPLCLAFPRLRAAAGLTGAGDLVVAGGESDRGPVVQVEGLAAGELTFSPVGDPLSERLDAMMVPVADGALLVGGRQLGAVLDSALVIDVAQGAQEQLPHLLECPRASASAARAGELALLFGGEGDEGMRDDYELVLLDPAVRRGGCSPLPDGIEPRRGAQATTVDERFVVITGGLTAAGVVSREVDLFDVETGLLCRLGELGRDRYLHSAAELSNARVLIVGGVSSATIPSPSARVELIGLEAVRDELDELGIVAQCADLEGLMAREEVPRLSQGRIAPTATALSTGAVLVAGGFDRDGRPLQSMEVFIP